MQSGIRPYGELTQLFASHSSELKLSNSRNLLSSLCVSRFTLMSPASSCKHMIKIQYYNNNSNGQCWWVASLLYCMEPNQKLTNKGLKKKLTDCDTLELKSNWRVYMITVWERWWPIKVWVTNTQILLTKSTETCHRSALVTCSYQ